MKQKRGTPAHEKLLSLIIQSRISKGLTQAELAELLGKPQSFISKIETGERRLDLVELIYVCDQIDLDPTIVLEEVIECVESMSPGNKKKVPKASGSKSERRGPRKRR